MKNQRPSILNVATCAIAFCVIGLGSSLSAQDCGACQMISQSPVSACSQGSAQGAVNGGPGTEMTKMINRMGLGSDCGRCKALANQMDQNGPEWVRQNRQYVVQRTISNAANLGHKMGPGKRLGVRILVQRSIQKSSFGAR